MGAGGGRQASFTANAHNELYAFYFCHLPWRAAVLARHVNCRDNDKLLFLHKPIRRNNPVLKAYCDVYSHSVEFILMC